MKSLNLVAVSDNTTVVSEYDLNIKRSDSYQSEDALEKEFIRMLSKEQKYEYVNIKKVEDLKKNLRIQLSKLNDYEFSDSEWERFYKNSIVGENEHIVEKTKKIQQDYVQVLKCDNGMSKNIFLIDKKRIHNNHLQVINQFVEKGGNHTTRYDVTILVNGLPLVHVELKRRGVSIREAFNQINRYQYDSFWASDGLFEYIQIFVISNGTFTKYYSNTTRNNHVKEQSASNARLSKKKSNSFEFTSFWADAKNKPLMDLVDFTNTFFAKHTLLNILTQYCVLTSEDILMVMRPYQIAATERILNRIRIAIQYKKEGSIEGGGYVWHTTGSGKTLTSFKTAQLATELPEIDKVLFVVDRQDLDYQTMKEYDKFEKGAANSNSSTKILQRQLENKNENGGYCDYKIIITTIQKLDIFVTKNPKHEIYSKRVVLIFDECHRSQFGEMHRKIVKAFKKYHIFGFTGTPIFAPNSKAKAKLGAKTAMMTTEQTFGEKLHTYTIVNAINDENVLPFRIDYVNTVKEKENVADEKIRSIDYERTLASPKRIKEVVKYILEHFNQKTKRTESYFHNKRSVRGFNSMFAVSSIPVAKLYYTEFKKQLKATGKDLIISTIFTFAPNSDEFSLDELESDFDTDRLDIPSREFLEIAIKDYNKIFKTNFDTSADKFQNYYKDLSARIKNREVDLVIVVNMFLTGFDSTTLNTLWVDKNLRMHGLIQAFSRTNRILNAVKTYGNIVCFRDLQEETDQAIALFGDENAKSIVVLRGFNDYFYGYEDNGVHNLGYVDVVKAIRHKFPIGLQIIGEKKKKEFIKLFGSILKFRNILMSFDEFAEKDIMKPGELQEYQSMYLFLYEQVRKPDGNGGVSPTDVGGDLEFEIELIKQVEINIDYILMLVEKYHATNCKDKEILVKILKSVDSSYELRSKKELIELFISNVNIDTDVVKSWDSFVKKQQEEELDSLIKKEKLKPEATREFIANAFRTGTLKTIGIDFASILPRVSMFGEAAALRESMKERVIQKVQAFFEKYFGLGLADAIEQSLDDDTHKAIKRKYNLDEFVSMSKSAADDDGKYK